MIVPRPFQKKFKSNYLNFKANHFIKRGKKNKKIDDENLHKENKKRRLKKVQRRTTCRNQKKGRASPYHGKKLSHSRPL